MATLDNDAPAIFAGSVDWIRAHVPAPPAAESPRRRPRDRRAGDGGTTGWTPSLWSPLRDVDPRIGEHLLDLLHAVGIAAYLEPSADVEPVHAHGVACPARRRTGSSSTGPAAPRPARVVDEHVPAGAERRRRARTSAGAAGAAERAAVRRRPRRGRRVGRRSSRPSRPRTAATVVDEPRRRAAPPPVAARAADPRPARTSTTSRRRPRRCRCRRRRRCTPSCWSCSGVLLVGAPAVLRLSTDVRPDPRRGRDRRRRRRCSSSRMRDRSDDDGGRRRRRLSRTANVAP